MKLYTEEQVREAIRMADKHYYLLESEEDGIISLLTPIELPSDEEIDIYIKSHNYDDIFENLIENGARWMRNKILNK